MFLRLVKCLVSYLMNSLIITYLCDREMPIGAIQDIIGNASKYSSKSSSEFRSFLLFFFSGVPREFFQELSENFRGSSERFSENLLEELPRKCLRNF